MICVCVIQNSVVVNESEYVLENTNRFMKWKYERSMSEERTKHVRTKYVRGINANPRQAQRQSSCVN